MGNSTSTNDKKYIDEINNINEDELDISNIDRLQIKAIKNLSERVEKLEKEKQNKIFYKLPAINICAPSLI